MTNVEKLETKLDEVVNKQAPQLPAGIRKFLFEWSPWIALVVGILNLFSAWGLWHAARPLGKSSYYIQQICSTYASTDKNGCDLQTTYSHLSFWLWMAIIFLIIQGVLYLRAYPRLRERQKSGWDFLYYAGLVYVAYAVITLFTGFDVVGHFVSAAIGVVISFYLLFQIRPLFVNSPPDTAPPVVGTHAVEPTVAIPATDKPAKTTKKKTTPKKSSPKKKS